MKFIIEELTISDFKNFEFESTDCLDDFLEFRIFINSLEGVDDIYTFMQYHENCYKDKKYQKYWDYALDKIIEKDNTGEWLSQIGYVWRNHFINYDKLFTALIKKDREGFYIYSAGTSWPKDKIDWNKLTNALIETDETGKWISSAGASWPEDKIDYNKLIDALIEKDKTGKWIEEALRFWPKKGKQILKQKVGGLK